MEQRMNVALRLSGGSRVWIIKSETTKLVNTRIDYYVPLKKLKYPYKQLERRKKTTTSVKKKKKKKKKKNFLDFYMKFKKLIFT